MTMKRAGYDDMGGGHDGKRVGATLSVPIHDRWYRTVSQILPALAMAATLSRPRTVTAGVTICAAPL